MLTLNIVIPTYRRNDLVKKRVREILAQTELDAIVSISICDNDPNSTLESELKAEFGHAMDSIISIQRRKLNIGASLNLALGILDSLPNYDYTWAISDDDEIISEALSQILVSAHENASCSALVFNESLPNIRVCTIAELLRSASTLDALLSLGNIVYARCSLDALPKGFFEYCPFMAPQLVVLFSIVYTTGWAQCFSIELFIRKQARLYHSNEFRQWSYLLGYRRLYEISYMSFMSIEEGSLYRTLVNRSMPKAMHSRSVFVFASLMYIYASGERDHEYCYIQSSAIARTTGSPVLGLISPFLKYRIFYSAIAPLFKQLLLISEIKLKLYRNSRPAP